MSTNKRTTIARFGRGSLIASAIAGGVMAMTLQGTISAQPAEGSVSAQGASQAGIISKLPANDLADVLRSNGFTEVTVDDEKTVIAKGDGLVFLFLIFQDGDSIQANAFWDLGDDSASLFDLNDWNAKYRFSKAIRLDSGNPCLQFDLVLTGGVTRERLNDYLSIVKYQTAGFRDQVINKDG